MTSFYRRLLQQLAFSESRQFSWDIDPANTMVRRLAALSPTTEANKEVVNVPYLNEFMDNKYMDMTEIELADIKDADADEWIDLRGLTPPCVTLITNDVTYCKESIMRDISGHKNNTTLFHKDLYFWQLRAFHKDSYTKFLT